MVDGTNLRINPRDIKDHLDEAKLTFRTVEAKDGEEQVIIEWAYKDGTLDWYDYRRGESAEE